MKSQCLPFSQIPHTTKVFADFLSYSPKVQRFYPRSPRLNEWMSDEAARLRYDSARRERVAAILDRQNRSWGASANTLANIEKLRNGAAAMVSGQQVGLFGGPLFTILKALTAAKMAEQATRAGIECVPVFWLASYDHDLAEVNHTSVPDASWVLQELRTPTQGVPDAPVGGLAFGPEITQVVEATTALLGDSEVAAWLREAYSPGQTFAGAFSKLCARLFADWGVILMDGSDPELHRIAEPIYRAAIERSAELNEALQQRGTELQAAGYHQQVKVTSSSTVLFTLRDGARVAVHHASGGADEFEAAGTNISRKELLDQISSAPENFSGNALLRPVVQDYLLPTIAYAGGPSEVAYFAQAAVLYEAFSGRTTPIVPRFSATIVEAKPQALLKRYELRLQDVFQDPEKLREQLAAGTLPKDLQSAFDQAESGLEKSMFGIRDALARLDATLIDSATNAATKMQYQIGQLRSRAARAELRQTEVLTRHADLLSNALYPKQDLQEREIAGVYFVARQGMGLLHDLYDTIHPDCLDHQIISL